MAGPWLLPIAGAVIGGGITAAKGGNFGDILKGAALGGATGGVAGAAGTALGITGTTAATTGAAKTAATAGAAKSAASGAAKAALTGPERLMQSALAPSTPSVSAASPTLLAPKYSVNAAGEVVNNVAQKRLAAAKEQLMYANLAKQGGEALGQLTQEEPKQSFMPIPEMAQTSVSPQTMDLYQQLLELSRQG